MNLPPSITVIIPDDGESSASFERRIAESLGNVLVVLSGMEQVMYKDRDSRRRIFGVCKKFSTRVTLAARSAVISRTARSKGITVIDSPQKLKNFLAGHPALNDALREFEPKIWRQELRSRLQAMGLLSLPKLRIWALILVSFFLLVFIVLRLLPSATVRVWPREETVSQTVNIFLAQSGAVTSLPERVRIMELLPITVEVNRTITFDQVSKQFTGKNARAVMKVMNNADEPYWLKATSKLRNEAGVVFRIEDSIEVPAGGATLVQAKADPVDVYGQIVGERGNVPAGVRWNFPGLTRDEQQLVYAINTEPATGASSTYRTILSAEDMSLAEKQMKAELLTEAKQIMDERKAVLNAEHTDRVYDLLYYDDLTKTEYRDIVLPSQFLGFPVQTVPVQGGIVYTMFAYDTKDVLDTLSAELASHVGAGRRLLTQTLTLDRLVAHVIDYDDNFSWVKITVDLSGSEQYVLDPLSPTGAVFARKVRDAIKGIAFSDAERILSNFPEVKRAELRLRPPWSRTLPGIPSSIVIEPIIE